MSRVLQVIAFWAIFVLAAAAQELGPEDLVKKVTQEVLDAIKSDKQLAAGDKRKAIKLAEEKVLPHVDFEEATRLAVGRSWAQATPEQRKKLVELYGRGIIPQAENTLESATINYRVNKVDFLTLLDSRLTLFNYQRDYFESMAEYAIKRAELEAVIGKDLD